MALQNNPIFKLASAVARGEFSREDAVEQSTSREFLTRLRNKTFDEVARATYANFCQTEPEPLPPELTYIALQCARRRGLQGELWGMLNWAHAFVSLQNGDVGTALKHVADARKTLRAGGFFHAMSLCDMLLEGAYACYGIDQRVSALRQSAHPARRELGGLNWAIRQLRLGTFLGAIGEHERAISNLTTAKSQFIRLQRDTQRYRFAYRKTLRSARSEFKKYLLLHVPSLIACDFALASSLFVLGKYDASLRHLLSGRHRAIQSGAVGLLGQLEILYAVTCRQLGDSPKAVKILEDSPPLGVSTYPMLRFRSQMYLATLYCDIEQYDKAISLLEKLRQSAEKEGLTDQVAECDRKSAWICRELGEGEKATRLLLSARKVFEDRGMDLDVAWCDADLSWLEVQTGKYEPALQVIQNLKSRPAYWVSPDFSQQCCHYLGHILWKLGRLEEARLDYAESIELIEQLRQGASQPELRASYLEAKRRVYFEAIDCCLEQGDYGAALEYVERLKSRVLAEMLQGRKLVPRNASREAVDEYGMLTVRMRAASQRLSEREGSPLADGLLKEFLEAKEAYQDVIHKLRKSDPGFDPEQNLSISYGDIRALMPDPATALIELFPMEDKTVAFLIVKDREIKETTVFLRDYTRDDLTHDLQAVHDKDRLESMLERLYSKLFEPIAPYLAGIQRLIFIPYSGLHLLPLHAMFTEKNGSRKYIIDDHLITYAPSAKILRLCLNRPPSDNHYGCVAWANPKRDLLFAQREAEAIAALQHWEILSAATRDSIIKEGRTAGVFHYTGHANGTALILHNSDDRAREDLYDTGDIFVGLDLPQASLVTLSACDTGKVREGLTDEYIGLPSAFLHAGASTVICSLWSVSDTSTTLLMAKMYRLMIRDGKGKAEALRGAQQWLKNPEKKAEHLQELEELVPWLRPAAGKPIPDAPRFRRTRPSLEKLLPEDLSHPYYWAGFICTGAP